MDDSSREIRKPGNLGHSRYAADPGRHDEVSRTQRTCPAFTSQVDRPAPAFVRGPADLSAGPEIEPQLLRVVLKPAGEPVLRNVNRPVRRERLIRKMIYVLPVVQRQRVITPAPVVAD